MPINRVGQHHRLRKKGEYSLSVLLLLGARNKRCRIPDGLDRGSGKSNKPDFYGITGAVYTSVVPSAHSNTSTNGVCTSNCTNENPIRSRAFNPSTPSSGSM